MSESDVRTRIIEVATHLFAQQGYGSTSVREVVEAAGVTKPTLYYWFANKEALFVEVVQHHLGGLSEVLGQTLAGDGTLRERLGAFLRVYVQGAAEHPEVVRLLSTAHHPSADGQPEVDVMSVHLRQFEMFGEAFATAQAAGELRADLDLRTAVLYFVGAANMHCMATVYGAGLDDGYVERMLELFFDGAAAPGGAR